MSTARKGLFLFVACVLILLIACGAALAAKPTKVLIITMDQMKPQYVKMFNMKNIAKLQKQGVNFTNAWVGQMASETVVSHNTIVSGLLPKHMGWCDEVMRDTGDVLGYGAGAIITVGDLGYADYVKLIENEDYPKLGDYMHSKFPGTNVYNLGEKGYQVESTAASSSDYYVRFGSKKNTADLPDPSVLPWVGTYRGPSGNVPAYIADNNRYKVPVANAADYYNTKTDKPAWLYPEDGRHVPGTTEGHLSGDVWVADAACDVFTNDPAWSAMHLNFSGIDKIGHMYGGGEIDTPTNFTKFNPASTWIDMVHMQFIAKTADDQVGKVVAKLKELGQLNSTMIVILADHGSTYAKTPHYVDQADGATASWYYDPNNVCANTTYGRAGANNDALLAPLNATGNLAYSYQSTAMEAWLIDRDWSKKLEAAAAMKTMQGVIATYVKWHEKYVLVSKGSMTKAERTWWSAKGQKLVNTMAASYGPDVIGLLKDKTSYGAYGDHGGAQKEVQRIPMVMWAKGIDHVNSKAQFRLVDVLPTVLKTMGIPQQAPMDGKAYKLPF